MATLKIKERHILRQMRSDHANDGRREIFDNIHHALYQSRKKLKRAYRLLCSMRKENRIHQAYLPLVSALIADIDGLNKNTPYMDGCNINHSYIYSIQYKNDVVSYEYFDEADNDVGGP